MFAGGTASIDSQISAGQSGPGPMVDRAALSQSHVASSALSKTN